MRPSRVSCAGLSLALACLLLPGCREALPLFLGVEELRAEELQPLLERSEPPWIIDLRDPRSFEGGHIQGALSLDLSELDGYLARRGPPPHTTLVTVCYHGRLSLAAAAAAASHGYPLTFSLSGGMARWQELGLPVVPGPGPTLEPALLAPPVLQASLLAQLAEAFFGVGVKATYMLLSLLWIVLLWRKGQRELVLIRRGLIFFLLGEGFCAVNYAFTAGLSDLLEMGHGAGMIVANALVPWGLFVWLDERILHLSDPERPCAAVRFCNRCWKREAVACGLQRLMLFAAPALAAVALMPLCAPLLPMNVVIPVLDTSLHDIVSLGLLAVEFRIYPLLAAGFLLLTFGLLLFGGPRGMRWAQAPFFAGLGFMTFALLRFFLYQSYRHMPLWSDCWEEGTEFLMVAAMGLLLFVFRRQWGLSRQVEPCPSPTSPA